jgi:hypothetical protein
MHFLEFLKFASLSAIYRTGQIITGQLLKELFRYLLVSYLTRSDNIGPAGQISYKTRSFLARTDISIFALILAIFALKVGFFDYRSK